MKVISWYSAILIACLVIIATQLIFVNALEVCHNGQTKYVNEKTMIKYTMENPDDKVGRCEVAPALKKLEEKEKVDNINKKLKEKPIPNKKDYKKYKKDDVEVMVKKSNTKTPKIKKDKIKKDAIQIDLDLSHNEDAFVTIIADDQASSVRKLRLNYKANKEIIWSKGDPYYKDGKWYEKVIPWTDKDEVLHYSWWTEHFTDFYVNSTNYTLRDCLVAINGTSDSCVINENGFTEVLNETLHIEFNGIGSFNAIQVTADNVYVDLSNTIINYTNAEQGQCYRLEGFDFYNTTLKNFICDGGGVQVQFNPSGFTDSVVIDNLILLNGQGSLGLVLKGRNMNISNIYIDGFEGVGNAIYAVNINTTESGNFNINNVEIYNSNSQGPLILLGSFNSESTYSNFYIENSVGINNVINFEYSDVTGADAFNVVFDNIEIVNSSYNLTEGFSGFLGIYDPVIKIFNFGNSNGGPITFKNSKIVNSGLDYSWFVQPLNIIHNGQIYNNTFLVSDTDLSSISINQQIVYGKALSDSDLDKGKPYDGTDDYDICLVANATGGTSFIAFLHQETNTFSCTNIANAVTGTLTAEYNGELVANGLTDYTLIGNFASDTNITYYNRLPEITYRRIAAPQIVINKAIINFINNSIVQNNLIDPLFGGVNFSGSTVTAYGNAFMNMNGITDIGSGSDLCYGNIGNWYSEETEPVLNDCGQVDFTPANNTVLYTYGGNFNLSWLEQDQFYGNPTITYDLFIDGNLSASGINISSYSLAPLTTGTHTLRIVPFSIYAFSPTQRYNATNDFLTLLFESIIVDITSPTSATVGDNVSVNFDVTANGTAVCDLYLGPPFNSSLAQINVTTNGTTISSSFSGLIMGSTGQLQVSCSVGLDTATDTINVRAVGGEEEISGGGGSIIEGTYGGDDDITLPLQSLTGGVLKIDKDFGIVMGVLLLIIILVIVYESRKKR